MSDSDSDCLSPRNLFNFKNESSICTKGVVKGPNIRSTVNLNFTTASHMPRNFENEMYDDGFSQRSHMSRHDRQEMSIRSVPVSRGGYLQPFHPGGMAHSSMMSSRAVSPTMSMRSMNSNASLAADYILSALQNMQFNQRELRDIKNTCNKLMKGRIHKKQSKRRRFLKGVRRRSGDDSGDQGSNSSLSSDDCRSTKTSATMYRGHDRYPHSGRNSDDTRSVRSSRSAFTDLPRAFRDSEMFRDRTEDFRQNSFKNMWSMAPRNFNHSNMSRQTSMNVSRSTAAGGMGPPGPVAGQRDRFRNNIQLPSLRFNNRSAVASIPEHPLRRPQLPSYRHHLESQKHEEFRGFAPPPAPGDSEEEIFNEVTVLEKTIQRNEKEIQENKLLKGSDARGKRNLNDTFSSESKRSKLDSPKKATPKKTPKNENKKEKQTRVTKEHSPLKKASSRNPEDFIFAKPQFPLKAGPNKVQKKPTKIDPIETTQNENKIETKLNEKQSTVCSKEPTVKEIIEKEKQLLAEENELIIEKQKTVDNSETTLHSCSDVSMRPSFMKRKLFTQTLDVTETKNGSNDSLSNSPESFYEAKEKNKARKIVTNSYYLSRDIQGDGNNHLDLIHKIVTRDQINLAQTNRSSDPVMGNKVDKTQWNLTSKSAVNIRNMTDSFTDEDIFVVHNGKKEKEKLLSKCTVVLDNLNPVQYTERKVVEKSSIQEKVEEPKPASKEAEKASPAASVKTNVTKESTRKIQEVAKKNYAFAFWNCDSESDAAETPRKKPLAKTDLNDSANMRIENATVKRVVQSNKSVEAVKSSKITKTNMNVSIKRKSTPIKKNVSKTTNSVLEPKSSTKEPMSMEEVGEKLNNSRSLRIRAIKELKEKKTQASKPLKPDLDETLYDVVKKRHAEKKSFSSTLESSKENSKNTTVINMTIAAKPTQKMEKKVAEKNKPSTQPKKSETVTNQTNKNPPKKTPQKITKTKALAAKTSPIKATRISTRLNATIDHAKASLTPTVTAKKMATKNIATKTVTRDLNQTMLSRRASMKQNSIRRSLTKTSPKSKAPKKATIKTNKVAAKDDKVLQSNNKIIKKTDSIPQKELKTSQVDGLAQSNAKIASNDGKVLQNKAPLSINNNNLNGTVKSQTLRTIIGGSGAAAGGSGAGAGGAGAGAGGWGAGAGGAGAGAAPRRRGRPRKHPLDPAKIQVSANKENENPDKAARVRKITTICECCDDPQTKHCIHKPAPSEAVAAAALVNNTARTRKVKSRADQGDVTQWGLGLSNATIGVVPRHCGREERCAPGAHVPYAAPGALDENRSMTLRSAASTSAVSRQRRPKYLHVF